MNKAMEFLPRVRSRAMVPQSDLPQPTGINVKIIKDEPGFDRLVDDWHLGAVEKKESCLGRLEWAFAALVCFRKKALGQLGSLPEVRWLVEYLMEVDPA